MNTAGDVRCGVEGFPLRERERCRNQAKGPEEEERSSGSTALNVARVLHAVEKCKTMGSSKFEDAIPFLFFSIHTESKQTRRGRNQRETDTLLRVSHSLAYT
jgi:hypothetical protein